MTSEQAASDVNARSAEEGARFRNQIICTVHSEVPNSVYH
jgi:hypothetical protein